MNVSSEPSDPEARFQAWVGIEAVRCRGAYGAVTAVRYRWSRTVSWVVWPSRSASFAIDARSAAKAARSLGGNRHAVAKTSASRALTMSGGKLAMREPSKLPDCITEAGVRPSLLSGLNAEAA